MLTSAFSLERALGGRFGTCGGMGCWEFYTR